LYKLTSLDPPGGKKEGRTMTAHWGNTTQYAPNLTGEGEDDIVIWVDTDSSIYTAWVSGFDSSKQAVAVSNREMAVGRPGIVGSYIAWAGTDGAGTLNIARADNAVRYDPLTFQEKAILWGRHGPAGPSICWANNRLYMAWADERGTINVGWSGTPLDAATWESIALPESAIDAPSISGGYGADVWLAWTGTDGNGLVNVASGFQPGAESNYRKTTMNGTAGALFKPNWPPAFQGPDSSKAGPQLEVDDLGLNLAYVGSNNNIYVIIALAGAFNRYKCTATTDAGPAVSGRVGEGGLAWRGLDGGFTLNTAGNMFTKWGRLKTTVEARVR
jgi:hypothetical protein